jgi:hypothetical protein
MSSVSAEEETAKFTFAMKKLAKTMRKSFIAKIACRKVSTITSKGIVKFKMRLKLLKVSGKCSMRVLKSLKQSLMITFISMSLL